MRDLAYRIGLPAALSLTIAAFSPGLATAGDRCCAHCGCEYGHDQRW